MCELTAHRTYEERQPWKVPVEATCVADEDEREENEEEEAEEEEETSFEVPSTPLVFEL